MQNALMVSNDQIHTAGDGKRYVVLPEQPFEGMMFLGGLNEKNEVHEIFVQIGNKGIWPAAELLAKLEVA